MASQSDILSPDDQNYLFEQLAQDNMRGMGLDFFTDETALGNLECPNGAPIIEEDLKVNQSFFPPVQTNILSNEEYSGPYEFEVEVHPSNTKHSWVYSPELNKVYMPMGSPFPIDFKATNRASKHLFIRITPVYSAPQFAQECVYRCLNHEFSYDKTDGELAEHIRPHIIRCTNKSAMYLGNKTKNERLSVVIPFSVPQTGTDSVREIFEFVCKNSCPSPGMNRRAIEIIFTLEDVDGTVCGRRTLNVRICSCPKRDKEKDEMDQFAGAKPPPGKKRKSEKMTKKLLPPGENDAKEYTLTIPLVGRHNEHTVLKYCHDLMAGEVLKRLGTGTEAPYKITLAKISSLIKECPE